MKTAIKKIVFVVVFLSICWLIGQYRNSEKDAQNLTESSDGNAGQTSGMSGMWASVTFEGNQKTEDTPWNMTAGKFEMEDEGECILLTPNTSVTLEEVDNVDDVIFKYEIHPWVKDDSDGAGLVIRLKDAKDTVLYEEEIAVSSSDEWAEYSLDLNKYDTLDKIELLCNNGAKDNDSCDWVVIKSE